MLIINGLVLYLLQYAPFWCRFTLFRKEKKSSMKTDIRFKCGSISRSFDVFWQIRDAISRMKSNIVSNVGVQFDDKLL